MKDFIVKNNLYIITSLGLIIAIYMLLSWSSLVGPMPFLQQMVGIFIIGLVLHLWEEQRFPGGFANPMAQGFDFTEEDIESGGVITTIYVLIIAFIPFFVPFFFTDFTFLTFLIVAPMLLGFLETGAHFVGSRMYEAKRFYSPGLATALFVLLPVSVLSIIYVLQHNLMQPLDWVFSLLYMAVGLISAQYYVVTSSGMKYRDFMKTVRKNMGRKKDQVDESESENE
ncbi:MAG: HXXEE domain-containing protein [Candidatus Thorarchaeota archaeon]